MLSLLVIDTLITNEATKEETEGGANDETVRNAKKEPEEELVEMLMISNNVYFLASFIPLIMEYLVKVDLKARIQELKRRYLKITVLKTNTPYPSRKIRREDGASVVGKEEIKGCPIMAIIMIFE
ncbi:hypothetical protein Tco_0433159 [Tanacetum coccineum]